MIDGAFVYLVVITSIVWAWAGVELADFPRQRLCWADGMFFVLNVGIFNFSVWA